MAALGLPTRPAWGPHRSVLRWGTLVGHPWGRWSSTRKTTTARPPTRLRVAARMRPRPRRTSRSRRRVRSHVRTVPISGRVTWRRSGSTRITPVRKGQRSGARPLRSSLGKPTGSPRSQLRGAPPIRRPSSLPARERCQRQEARVLDAVGEGSLGGDPAKQASRGPLGDLGPPPLAGPSIHALAGLRPVPAPAEPGDGRRLLRLTGLGSPRSRLRGAPLSRSVSRSAFRVRTAQLEAERRPPPWRWMVRHRSGVGSRANQNAGSVRRRGRSTSASPPSRRAASARTA